MSLRTKLAVALAALAAVATVIVGSASYLSTGNVLRRQVDTSLAQAARRIEMVGLDRLNRPPAERGFEQILVQVIGVDGDVIDAPRGGALPVDRIDRKVAEGDHRHTSARRTVTLDGEEYRMLTVRTVDDAGRATGAVQLARSLGETSLVLLSIRNRTLLMVLLLSAIAALVGVFIAKQVTKRLVHLTDVADSVARSGQLDTPVPVDGGDETGRLGRAFQAMLSSLSRSRQAQQQLVQDAGHELRTPLTSLRTNVTVMQRFDELSPESRQRLLADVDSETRELSALVDELVALATDQAALEPLAVVSLGEAAERAAERARRRWGRTIDVRADESAVAVRPQALDRAISNLVNNAIKFTDAAVEVVVAAGRLEVRDRGPGIAPADLPRVFDRFYRSDAARALPGSGLGLAIVRDMAERHGGSVFAANRPDGGAVIGFALPVVTDPIS